MQATTKKPYGVSADIRPSPVQRTFARRVDRGLRRLLEICAAFVGLIALSPFFAYIAYRIKKDSPGPIFFWGRRMGLGGREFRILKFRTMYETPASHAGPKVTAQGDCRITPVGEWLRSTKLNELPQLWNVLIGDMSLVGPRPEDPDIVLSWPEDARRELLSVRPGITSPASVVYRDEEALLKGDNIMDDYLRSILPTKLRFDQVYLRNRNLLSDLDVIFWTFIVLIPQARKEKIPEQRLYWGPLSVFFTNDFRWFIMDFCVALFCVGGVGVLWRSFAPLNIGWQYAPGIAFLMALAFGLSNALRGLNRVIWAKASPSDTLDLLFSTGVAVAFLWMTNRTVFHHPIVPTGLFIIGGMIAFLGFVSVRYRERLVTGLATRWLALRKGGHIMGERLLIVGAGELGQFATWLVHKGTLAQAFNIIGFVDDDPRKQGLRMDGVTVLGATAEIKSLVERHDIGIVLYAISNIRAEERARILSTCQDLPIRTILMPNVVEMMRDEFRVGSISQNDKRTSSLLHPSRALTWLGYIEDLLQAGEYEALQMQIEHLRTEIRLGQRK